MSLHQEILPTIVQEIKSFHPDCSIALIGSVAAGRERADSDLDLNLFHPDEETVHSGSPYADSDNRWQLRVKKLVRGIRIDVAWETYAGLALRLDGDGVANCWPFANGQVLHDPQGVAGIQLLAARKWFHEHPDVARAFEADYQAKKKQQRRIYNNGGE